MSAPDLLTLLPEGAARALRHLLDDGDERPDAQFLASLVADARFGCGADPDELARLLVLLIDQARECAALRERVGALEGLVREEMEASRACKNEDDWYSRAARLLSPDTQEQR